jgi:hypothetical protein
MPLKTNVGVSRKVADNYGSRGASVNLEVELDSTLINDPERFHNRIRQVFRLAQQAIDDELTRQQQAVATPSRAPSNAASTQTAEPAHTGGNGATGNQGNGNSASGNGHRNGNSGHGASEKQLSFARQLSKGIQGLGVRRLETLAQKMFGKPLTALSTMDASGLIDTLKSIKDGKIDLESVLEGNAA